MIFCDSYLPGYKGGGGMRAVHNLADCFKDQYDFFVVTRDCDGKLDRTPFVRAARNIWNERSEAKVFYASPAKLNRKTFETLVREVDPHLIYLNSVFSYVCVKFLLTRLRARLRDIPLILAPCGEFAVAALNLKFTKKRSFLAFARLVRLFEGVVWKASSTSEKGEIASVIGLKHPILVAPELLPRDLLPDFSVDNKTTKVVGEVKLIYLSRVTPIKNLLFLLEILCNVKVGIVHLEVVGPSDDEEYFDRCVRFAASLPANIRVDFHGGKRFDKGLEFLKNGHFMVLPTLKENFGYVTIEALAAGCPVIASDQIAWDSISNNELIRRISLVSRSAWFDAINDCILMDNLTSEVTFILE